MRWWQNNDEMQIHPSQDGAVLHQLVYSLVFVIAGGYLLVVYNSWHTNLAENGLFRSAVNMGNA